VVASVYREGSANLSQHFNAASIIFDADR